MGRKLTKIPETRRWNMWKTHTVRKVYAIKTVSLKTASKINLIKNF